MQSHAPILERKRVRFSHPQQVHADPERIFPLLCPVREYDWIPPWDCTMIYSESGVAEKGCIFQTDREAEGGLDTWVVSEYEPPRRIAFVRVNPFRAISYEIGLSANEDGSTRLDWSQTITALNDEGDRLVAGLRKDDFVELIGKLEAMLNHYLATGKALSAA